MADASAPSTRPRDTLVRVVAPAVLLGLLALAPTLSSALDNPFLIRLFTRAVVFGVAAVALNVVLGYGGLVSLMHAGLAGVGAYAVAILAFHDFDGSKFLGIVPGTGNLAISMPVAMALSGLVAALTGVVALRTSGAYFIMITLAFNQMLYYFFVALQKYGGDDGLQILGGVDFAGFDISKRATFYYFALAALAIEIVFFARLVESRFGMILRACAQNERRVAALGVPPLRHKLAAFAISGAAAGLAGALWATGQQFVSPSELSWVRSGDYIVMAVLGGMGMVWGPVLGAIAYVLLESFLPAWTQFWQAPFGVVVVLIVVFLRGGLLDLVGGRGARANGGGH